MTIAQFLNDLDEVVGVIQKRFHKEKIVLLGESWGTALGTIYAVQHPEKVAAYVGIGQVANMPEGERLSYDYAITQARASGNEKAVEALCAIGPPPHPVDEMLTFRRWVGRFGGSFHTDLSTGKLIWAALNTDEANLVDLILFGRGNRFSLEHLWPEFSQLDLTVHQTFETAVFFLLGRYESLAGSWTTQTKEWMTPGKPPMESSGTVEMKSVLDGRFLQQEFTCSMMGQPCSGIGPTGYDNSRKKYVPTWIDSMGTGIFLMEGTASADGKTITLKGGHDEPGGGDMTHRAIWKLIDDNAQILEMYGAHKGDKEVKAMEIIYTRKQSLGVESKSRMAYDTGALCPSLIT